MRPLGRIAVVSWLGGTASVVPFAEGWFDLSGATADWALFAAIATSVALGFGIALWAPLRHLVDVLAGPPEPRARALVLVAVFAGSGALVMSLVLWLLSAR